MLLKLVNITAIFCVVVLLPEVIAHNSAYCYRQQSETRTRHVSFITYATRTTYFYTRCGWWDWDLCRRTRYHRVSLTSYRVQHYTAYRSEHYCCAGYTQNGTSCIRNQPECSPICVHGECVTATHNTTGHAHGVCVCHVGWNGSDCRQAICSPHCLNGGTCITPGHCICAHGYSGERCDEAECSPSCVHGECVAATHNTTGHAHGVCVCHVGWDGSDCRQAICSPHCLNGGTCITPGHCSCAHGYSGDRCDEAECSPICLHGDCVQHECVCNLGWTGLDCRDAICSPSCLNGGTCITPGHCICQHGYDGYRCEQEQ